MHGAMIEARRPPFSAKLRLFTLIYGYFHFSGVRLEMQAPEKQRHSSSAPPSEAEKQKKIPLFQLCDSATLGLRVQDYAE
jgi:hypothetical protein